MSSRKPSNGHILVVWYLIWVSCQFDFYQNKGKSYEEVRILGEGTFRLSSKFLNDLAPCTHRVFSRDNNTMIESTSTRTAPSKRQTHRNPREEDKHLHVRIISGA